MEEAGVASEQSARLREPLDVLGGHPGTLGVRGGVQEGGGPGATVRGSVRGTLGCRHRAAVPAEGRGSGAASARWVSFGACVGRAVADARGGEGGSRLLAAERVGDGACVDARLAKNACQGIGASGEVQACGSRSSICGRTPLSPVKQDELAGRTRRGSLVGTNEAIGLSQVLIRQPFCHQYRRSRVRPAARPGRRRPPRRRLPVIAAGDDGHRRRRDGRAARWRGGRHGRHRSAAQPRPLLLPWLPPTDAAMWAWSHTGPGRTGGALRLECPSSLRQSARSCPLRDQRRASIIRNPDTLKL